jgi:hypothetical protein
MDLLRTLIKNNPTSNQQRSPDERSDIRVWSELVLADLPPAQAQSHVVTATKQPDRQITENLSSPSRKNIPLNMSGKSAA